VDTIARRDKRILALQRRVSFLFFPIVAPTALFWVRVIKRLSVRDAEIVRARFANPRSVTTTRSSMSLCLK